MSAKPYQDPECDLEHFERAVYARDYKKATDLLIQSLISIERRTWDLVVLGDEGAERSRNDRAGRKLLTRFCGAITTLFADPAYNLPRDKFELMVAFKRYLVTVFAATPYDDMVHLLDFIGTHGANGKVEYTSQSDFFKIIMACTASFGKEMVLELLRVLPKDLGFLLWLSLLDNEMVLTEEGNQIRAEALAFGERFESVIPSDTAVSRAINTWMFCSYLNVDNKHDVKKHLNNLIKRYAQKRGAKQPYVSQQRTLKDLTQEKPVLLVIAERFTSNHAMYRCYGPLVESLSGKFKLVLLSIEKKVDEKSLAMFDQSIVLGKEDSIKNIKAFIGEVFKLKPDMIFYPSIGMETWSIGLAQYRLAPIQVMSLGHPATTHLDNIDYVITEESFIADPDTFSETVVALQDGAIAFTEGAQSAPVPAVINRCQNLVKIAVPSISYKLNSELLDACKAINEGSSRPVEFHFYPNMAGINYLSIRTQLQNILPCVVHESKSYEEYINSLNQCDLVLSPFPFGNTNGLVDSVRQGLPVVCRDGREAHSHYDSVLSKRVGLPEFCSAQTTQDYIAAAIKLVDDEDLRVQVSEGLLATDINSIVYGQHFNTQADGVALFAWLYENHEAIAADGRHYWPVAERTAFNKVKPQIDQSIDQANPKAAVG